MLSLRSSKKNQSIQTFVGYHGGDITERLSCTRDIRTPGAVSSFFTSSSNVVSSSQGPSHKVTEVAKDMLDTYAPAKCRGSSKLRHGWFGRCHLFSQDKARTGSEDKRDVPNRRKISVLSNDQKSNIYSEQFPTELSDCALEISLGGKDRCEESGDALYESMYGLHKLEGDNDETEAYSMEDFESDMEDVMRVLKI